MAIAWGPTKTGGGYSAQLGYEFYQTGDVASGSVQKRLNLWIKTSVWATSSSNNLAVSGSWSRSGAVNVDTRNSNPQLLWSGTITVATSYSGPVVTSFSASLSGIGPGTISVSGSHTTGQRPPSIPAAPTGLALTRTSDGQHNISWVNHPTSTAPYTGLEIRRWDRNNGAFVHLLTRGPAATAWSDMGTVRNNRYQWGVRAINGTGASPWVYTPQVATSPNAPSDLVVTREGADIHLVWSRNAHPEAKYEVYEARDGVWGTTPVAVTDLAAWEWVHVAPDTAVTHQYRVQAVIDDPIAGRLVSGYSQPSAVVQLAAAPLAPTLLAPVSVPVDADEPVRFGWRHNPVDASGQTAREVEVQTTAGAPTWSPGRLNGTDEYLFMPVGYGLVNGQAYRWRSRTWGQHADPSPWSPWGTFTTSARPTVDINSPAGTHNSSSLTVGWGYYDAEGTAQTGWRATLYDAAGTTLEVRSGNGPATTVTFARVLADATTYRVGVAARDGAGLWSTEAVKDVPVSYAPPPPPGLEVLWDVDRGAVIVDVTNPMPGDGQVDTDHNLVHRRIGDGPWVLVHADVPPGGSVVDTVPHLTEPNTYKVTAISALPSSAESVERTARLDTGYGGPGFGEAPFGEGPFGGFVVAAARHLKGWVFLNAGPAFTVMGRVRGNATLSKQASRTKTLHHFVGHDDPVEFVGESRTLTGTLAVSRVVERAVEAGEASAEDLEALADMPAPICLRTTLGHRWFVSLGEVSSDYAGVKGSVSVPFTKVSHDE